MIRNTLLKVEGMSCHSCVGHVDEALRGLEGVSEVRVQLDRGRVDVQHDEDLVDPTTLVEALRDAGYESEVDA